MNYQVKLKPSAEKELSKFSQKDYYRIMATLTGLAVNPFIGKKLEGKYKGYYSIRVWPHRIIYQIYKKELLIFIICIGHRRGVYK
ncbi:MAG: type II toxin-antitoxin system RelE/ParE family toxin [Patescibacteria group bacterium]